MDNPLYKKGDNVKLIFNETGKIVKVETYVWFHKYFIKIKKATFNKTNQVIDCLEKDILGLEIKA